MILNHLDRSLLYLRLGNLFPIGLLFLLECFLYVYCVETAWIMYALRILREVLGIHTQVATVSADFDEYQLPVLK